MMRTLSCCLMCVVWLSCSGDAPSGLDSGQPERVEWSEGDVVVAMGTSLTFGYGSGCRVLPPRNPCSGDSSYPTLLNADLRLPVINLAQPRSTTVDGLAQMQEALQHQPVLVLLEYGANDLIQGVPLAQARANLSRMIEGFHAEGVAVVLLSALHPDMVDKTPQGHQLQRLGDELLAYSAMVAELADAYQLPLVSYIFEGIWWNRQLMFDGLHPNGMGYLIMKENILTSLHDFFSANDMLGI